MSTDPMTVPSYGSTSFPDFESELLLLCRGKGHVKMAFCLTIYIGICTKIFLLQCAQGGLVV